VGLAPTPADGRVVRDAVDFAVDVAFPGSPQLRAAVVCPPPRADPGPGAMGRKKGAAMLWTIALILLVLWALGMVSSYTLGGFIHILLVVAIIVVLLRVIEGRRVI
jgi:hypothetical protein